MQRLSLDNRFVIPPYTPVAWPYCQGYPTFVYPKQDDPRIIRMLEPHTAVRMRPYVFKHDVPPNYRDTWDYNQYDRAVAQLNDIVRNRARLRFAVL